jgi:hypothetical protein
MNNMQQDNTQNNIIDNYGVPIRPGDLIVYRAGANLRIGRVNERQVTHQGKILCGQVLIQPLEQRARTIWRRISDIVRVHEFTLTLAKLMGRKSFVEEVTSDG